MGKYLRIDDVAGASSSKQIDDTGQTIAGNVTKILVRPAKCVRRDNNIVHRKQRIAGVDGLVLEDVEPGTCDGPLAQGRDQCRLFNDRSASDVDEDRKSTRLNSSHANISYAVFCLKKK